MLHPVSSLAGLGAGCSAMSWETEDRRHLWGRNLDFNTLASDSRITYIPRGTSYATCEQRPESRFCSAYAAVGTGLLSGRFRRRPERPPGPPPRRPAPG